MFYYAGIGSRATDSHVFDLCVEYGQTFARMNMCLRSGGAHGCDHAFEVGCDKEQGKKEIFLPWKKFNQHGSDLFLQERTLENKCLKIAFDIDPSLKHTSWPVQRLHARNVQQIMGLDPGTTPLSTFVVCWSPRDSKTPRGTMFAIHLAKKFGIQVFNFYDEASPHKIDRKVLDAKIEYMHRVGCC